MPDPKVLLRIFLAISLFLSLIDRAEAQHASVAITPASLDATVKPGSSYTQSFTLTNSTGAPLRFRCTTADMWFDEQNKRITGRPGTLPRSASMWMQFSPSEITVPAFGSAVVRAVITVPSYATGSFYTVPVFEGLPVVTDQVKTTESTASIGFRFRGLIMLTTHQGSEYNVEVAGERVISPSASAPLELALDLKNRGSAHARVRGNFVILSSTGAMVGRGKIDEKRFLPSQRDILKSNWSGNLPPGSYTCVVAVSYNRVGQDAVSFVREIPFQVR